MILTVGRHGKGVWGPTQARKEAIRLLGLIRDGKDPAVERAEDKAAPTLAELAQRYMSEYAERQKKPRSVEEDRRLLRHGQNKGDTETNGQTGALRTRTQRRSGH